MVSTWRFLSWMMATAVAHLGELICSCARPVQAVCIREARQKAALTGHLVAAGAVAVGCWPPRRS